MLLREDDIRNDMANGVPKRDTVMKLADKYKVARRTIEDLYYKVGKDVANALEKSTPEIAAIVFERKNRIFNEAMAQRKLKVALDATMAIGKMASLYDKTTEIDKDKPSITITEADYSTPLRAVGDDSEEGEA